MKDICLQVLGLFTVVATTLGTLYFVDTDKLANSQGLDAVGVLLLILNASFVLLMLILVLVAARHDIKRHIDWTMEKAKAVACRVTGRPRVSRQWSRLNKTASGDNASSTSPVSSPTQQLAFITSPGSTSPVI